MRNESRHSSPPVSPPRPPLMVTEEPLIVATARTDARTMGQSLEELSKMKLELNHAKNDATSRGVDVDDSFSRGGVGDDSGNGIDPSWHGYPSSRQRLKPTPSSTKVPRRALHETPKRIGNILGTSIEQIQGIVCRSNDARGGGERRQQSFNHRLHGDTSSDSQRLPLPRSGKTRRLADGIGGARSCPVWRRLTLGQVMRGDGPKGVPIPATGHATMSAAVVHRPSRRWDCGGRKEQGGGKGGGVKLAVVSKYITHISGVPASVASPVTQLLLSNNSLHGLGHLSGELFPNLETVSLGNNQLRYLEMLVPLTTLPRLSSLILEGNPVTHMPNYRAQLVVHLGALTTLDKHPVGSDPDFHLHDDDYLFGRNGVQITRGGFGCGRGGVQGSGRHGNKVGNRAAAPRERAAAAAALRREASLQEALFDNACAARALQCLRPLLAVHNELRQRLLGAPLIGRAAHLPDGGFGDVGGGGFDRTMNALVPSPTLSDVLRVWRPSHWVRRFRAEARRVHQGVQDELALRFYRTLEARAVKGSAAVTGNAASLVGDTGSSATSKGGFGNYIMTSASSATARSLSAAETHQLWDVLMTQQLQAQQEVLVVLVRSCELNRENAGFYRSARARRRQHQQSQSNVVGGGEGLRQFLQAESAGVAAQLIQAKATVAHHHAASNSSHGLGFGGAGYAAPLSGGGGGVGHQSCRPLWGPPSLPAEPGCNEHDDRGYQPDHNKEQNDRSMDTFSAYDAGAAAGGLELNPSELNPSASAPISSSRKDGHSSLLAVSAAASSDGVRRQQSCSRSNYNKHLENEGGNARVTTTGSAGAPGTHVGIHDDGAYAHCGVGGSWDSALADISEPNGTHLSRQNTAATVRGGGGSGDRDFNARTAAAAVEAALGADQYLQRIQQQNNAASASSLSLSYSTRQQRGRYDEQPDADHGGLEFGPQGGNFRGNKNAQGLSAPSSAQPAHLVSQVQMAPSEKSSGGGHIMTTSRSELARRLQKQYQSTKHDKNADNLHVVQVRAEMAADVSKAIAYSHGPYAQQQQQQLTFGTNAISRPSSGQSRSNLVQAGNDSASSVGRIGMNKCEESNASERGYHFKEGSHIADFSGSVGNCRYQYQHQSFHPDDVANAETMLRRSLADLNLTHDDGVGDGCVLTLEALPASPTSLEALIRNGSHGSGGGGQRQKASGYPRPVVRPVVPEPVEAGHSMRELEGQVSGALDDLTVADAGLAEMMALNAALRSQVDEVLQLRDRRLKTLLATEERLVQRHNDYIHTIAEMARDMRGGQAIVSGPSDQDNSSNENHSDTVVLRLDEKVSEDAEEKRARGEDLKQAQVEKRERQAILDAVMTRVEEAQASVDEEERCRDKLVAAKQRTATDTTRLAAKLAEIRTAFMLSASRRTVGGVRLRTLEESGLAYKLFDGGTAFASWAFTRLRRACDIRRRFRNSPVLGVGAAAGGYGGGYPLRRQFTYFRRLRLSTRLKRLRKRLRMVRALRSWRVYFAVVKWKQGVQGPRRCRAAVKRWWGRVADRKERRRVLESHLMEGARAAHKDTTLLYILEDLLRGGNGKKLPGTHGGNLQLRRFFSAWHAHAHGIAKQVTTIALAFWCVRFLRRWLRLASFNRVRLTARGEFCGAKRLLVRWRRRWQVERLSHRAFKRRALLQIADTVTAAKRWREHRATAGYLGERALVQRTFWIFRQESRNLSRARLVLHRIEAINKTEGLVRGFTCWKAVVYAARVQQTVNFLSAAHFLHQLQQRLWLRWRRIVYRQRELRCLLHDFVQTCALSRQQGAFRSWLWKLVGPVLLGRFVDSLTAQRVQRLLRAWAAVGAMHHRFSTLSAVVEERHIKRLRRVCFSGWVAGALRFSLRRLYDAEQRRGDAMERELDEQFADVLPRGRAITDSVQEKNNINNKACTMEFERYQEQQKHVTQVNRERLQGGNEKAATTGTTAVSFYKSKNMGGGEEALSAITRHHYLAPSPPHRPATITSTSSVPIDDLAEEDEDEDEERADGELPGTTQERILTGANTRMKMHNPKHQKAFLRYGPLVWLRRRLGFAEHSLAAAVAESTAESDAVAGTRTALSALQRQAVAGHVDSEKLQAAAEAEAARTAQLAAELAAKKRTLDDCAMAVELLKAELRSVSGGNTSEGHRGSDDNDGNSDDHEGDQGIERDRLKEAVEAGVREAPAVGKAANGDAGKALKFSVPTLDPSVSQRLSELSCEVRKWQRKEAAAMGELVARETDLKAAVGLEGTTGIRVAATSSTEANSGDQAFHRNGLKVSGKSELGKWRETNGEKREHRSGASSVTASATMMQRTLPLSCRRAAGRGAFVMHGAEERGLSALEMALGKTRALATELDERDAALAALAEERDALLECLAETNEGRSVLFGAVAVAVAEAEAEAEAEAIEAANWRLRERLEVQRSTADDYEERLEAARAAMQRAEAARRTKLGKLASTSDRTMADFHIAHNQAHDDARAGGGAVVLDDPVLHLELAEQRSWRKRWEVTGGLTQQVQQNQMGMVIAEDSEVLSGVEAAAFQPHSDFGDATNLGGTERGRGYIGGSMLADAAAFVEVEIAQERAATAVAAAHDAAVMEGVSTRLRILRVEQAAVDATFRAQASSMQSMERAVGLAGEAAVAKLRVDETIRTAVARGGGIDEEGDLSGGGVHIGQISGIEVGQSHTTTASYERDHLLHQHRNQNQDQGQNDLRHLQEGTMDLRPISLRRSALTQVNQMSADTEPPLKVASQAVRELLGRARRGVVEGRLRSSRCALRESFGVGVDHNLTAIGHISNDYSAPGPDRSPDPGSNPDLGAIRSVPLEISLLAAGESTSAIAMLDEGKAADSAIWVGHSMSGCSSSLEELEAQQPQPPPQQQPPQQGEGVEMSGDNLQEAHSRMVALKANITQLSNRIAARMNARACASAGDAATNTTTSPSGAPVLSTASLSPFFNRASALQYSRAERQQGAR